MATLEPTSVSFENNQSKLVLKGVFRIGGQRNFTLSWKNDEYLLLCNRFWDKKDIYWKVSEKGVHLFEVFEIFLDDFFSKRNSYIFVELIKINNKSNRGILGLMCIPLQQLYAAYHNASVTNGVHSKELPTISVNCWVPVMDLIADKVIGELECLLGVGTTGQLENMKFPKNWENYKCESIASNITVGRLLQTKMVSENTTVLNTEIGKNIQSLAIDCTGHKMEIGKINKTFRLYIEIECAKYLPFNQISMKKSGKHARSGPASSVEFPLGEESPSSYVTFKACGGYGPLVKSYEGMVFSTGVKKSSTPKWKKPFYIFISSDHLVNKNGRFIFKVWRTINTISPQNQLVPNPMKDSVIGLAAINFTTFPENISFINEWFNIVDLYGDIKGQIKATIRYVDDIQQILNEIRDKCDNKNENILEDIGIHLSADSNYVNLNQAIRRKFNELEQISLRLKARLLDVTNNVEYVSNSRESQLDEFEHDLNTPVNEEDESDFFSSQAASLISPKLSFPLMK